MSLTEKANQHSIFDLKWGTSNAAASALAFVVGGGTMKPTEVINPEELAKKYLALKREGDNSHTEQREYKPSSVTKYISELNADLDLLPHPDTGFVRYCDSKTGKIEIREPSFSSPSSEPDPSMPHKGNRRILQVLSPPQPYGDHEEQESRIRIVKPKAEMTYEEASRIVTAFAHLDGALWPHRMPPMDLLHDVAVEKLREVPGSYRLLTAPRRILEPRNISGGDIVHGYVNLWRADSAKNIEVIHKNSIDAGSATEGFNQRSFNTDMHSVQMKILHGIFTAVQLAPYFRVQLRVYPSQVHEMLKSSPLVRAIFDMLQHDMEKNYFYETLWFVLSHSNDAAAFRLLNEELPGLHVRWYPRFSRRDILCSISLLPWKLLNPQLPFKSLEKGYKAATVKLTNPKTNPAGPSPAH